jgi:hypothetical protein
MRIAQGMVVRLNIAYDRASLAELAESILARQFTVRRGESRSGRNGEI